MPEERHESQEPNLRGLLTAALIMAAAIVFAVGVSLGLVQLFGGFGRPLARAEHRPMPEPHLQPHPLSDRARYDAQQRAHLTGYAWVDRKAGIVRIPIDRAMQILVEERASATQPAAVPRQRSPGPHLHVRPRAGARPHSATLLKAPARP